MARRRLGLLLLLLSAALLGQAAFGEPAAEPGRAMGGAAPRLAAAPAALATATPAGPRAAPPLPLARGGAIGWDPVSGQAVAQPSIERPARATAVQPAAGAAARAAKGAQAGGAVTFRSGYRASLPPGVDPALTEAGRAAGSAPGAVYGVLQFPYPVEPGTVAALRAAGVTFFDYAPPGALLARVPVTATAALAQAVAAGRLRHAGPIPPEARLPLDFARAAAAEPAREFAVSVLFFEAPSADAWRELTARLHLDRPVSGPGTSVEGRVAGQDVAALAALPWVRWLEPRAPKRPANWESSAMTLSDVLLTYPAGGQRYDGTGVIVGSLDTGVAQQGGVYHPDLAASRIVDQRAFYPAPGPVADDQFAHGTHTLGTIAGSGTLDGRFRGHAPGASLAVYKLCCDDQGEGFHDADIQAALTAAAAAGAAVVNHSWGGGNGVYDTSAELLDRAVRGEFGGRRALQVVSAGNETDLIAAPGTAKNVLTVGAVRDGNLETQDAAPCGSGNFAPGDAATFTNHGPIDGRVKPDLVASGVCVTSAVPSYLGGGAYRTVQGTSAAAPAVTGSIAQWLQANPTWADWPEVVKAVFLASAIDLGGDAGTARFGRGLADALDATLSLPGVTAPGGWWGDRIEATGAAGSIDYLFNVPPGADEVRAVLAWSDPAGPSLANDLDLEVFDAAGASVGRAASTTDPVAFLRLRHLGGFRPGTWRARVSADSLVEPQRFGLAATVIVRDTALSATAVLTPTASVTRLAPGATLTVETAVANAGYSAGGAYLRLLASPAHFDVQSVALARGDGATLTLTANQLSFDADGSARVALGSVDPTHVRRAVWSLRVRAGAPPGLAAIVAEPVWLQRGQAQHGQAATLAVGVGPAGAEQWQPWYDNVAMRSWIHVVNPSAAGPAATVDVYLGGSVAAGGVSVPPGATVPLRFTDVVTGPVRLVATNGVPILSTQRVLYPNPAPGSFAELAGSASERLATEYWLPWYDNTALQSWLHVTNPLTPTTATVDIWLGATRVVTGTVIPGGGNRPIQLDGLKGGPVHVVSTNGVPILVTERAVLPRAAPTGFHETNAATADDLDSEWWFPWYDNNLMQSWLLAGNAAESAPPAVDLWIGPTRRTTGHLLAANTTTVFQFGLTADGPVRLSGPPGVRLFASQRSVIPFAAPTSFNEVLGLPSHALGAEYWLPWYDGDAMRSWVLVAAPASNVGPANVEIRVGGTVRWSGTLVPGERATPSFDGLLAGPIRLRSLNGQPIVASERSLYRGAFNETLAIPAPGP